MLGNSDAQSSPALPNVEFQSIRSHYNKYAKCKKKEENREILQHTHTHQSFWPKSAELEHIWYLIAQKNKHTHPLTRMRPHTDLEKHTNTGRYSEEDTPISPERPPNMLLCCLWLSNRWVIDIEKKIIIIISTNISLSVMYYVNVFMKMQLY